MLLVVCNSLNSPNDEEDWLFVSPNDEEDWLIVAAQDVNEEMKKMNNYTMNC